MDKDQKPQESQEPTAQPTAQNPFSFTGNTETTQDTGSTDGKSSTTEPISSSELTQSEKRKLDRSLRKLDKVDKALLILSVITFLLALFFIVAVLGNILPGAQPSETDSLAMFLALFYVGPPLVIFGVLTLTAARKVKSTGQRIGKTIRMAGIITAILIVVLPALSVFTLKNAERRSERQNQEYWDQYYREQKLRDERREGEAISISRAAELLESCEVSEMRYYAYRQFAHNDVEEILNEENDGVVLANDGRGNPVIYIAERAEAQLTPLAEEAVKNCPGFAARGKI